MLEWVSRSPEETERLGVCLAKYLRAGDIVCLDGDLGAGKTALTRGIAEGLGIRGMVSSPTFMLVIEHENEDGPALFHFDAYRLSGAEDFFDAGLDEYFYRGGVCVIEWSDVIRDAFAAMEDRMFRFRIRRTDEQEREIGLEWPVGREQDGMDLYGDFGV